MVLLQGLKLLLSQRKVARNAAECDYISRVKRAKGIRNTSIFCRS